MICLLSFLSYYGRIRNQTKPSSNLEVMAVFTLGDDVILCLLCVSVVTFINYWPYSGVVMFLIVLVLVHGIVD